MAKKYLKNEKGIVRSVTTDNLQLEKPLLNENYDINVHNRNMDKIDVAIQEVKGTVGDLKLNVSNGKKIIASAITDKGIDTSDEDTFQTMAENIKNITVEILGGKKFASGKAYTSTSTSTFKYMDGTSGTALYYVSIPKPDFEPHTIIVSYDNKLSIFTKYNKFGKGALFFQYKSNYDSYSNNVRNFEILETESIFKIAIHQYNVECDWFAIE